MSLKLILVLLLALTSSIAAAKSAPASEPEPEPSSRIKPKSDPPEPAVVGAEEAIGAGEVAGAGEGEGQRKKHSDRSVAGGGVIIGGLLTAVCMAVFCYIRVTRKRDDELPMFVNRTSTDALVLDRQSVTSSSPPSH